MLQSASFGKGFCTQKRWFYTKFVVTKKLKEFFHTFIGEKNIFENNVWDFYFSPFFPIVNFFLLSIKRLSRTFSYYLRLLKRVSFLVIFFSFISLLFLVMVMPKSVKCEYKRRLSKKKLPAFQKNPTCYDCRYWCLVDRRCSFHYCLLFRAKMVYCVCVCVSLFYW